MCFVHNFLHFRLSKSTHPSIRLPISVKIHRNISLHNPIEPPKPKKLEPMVYTIPDSASFAQNINFFWLN